MALFRPTAVKPRIGEVTPRLLRRLGARAVLLDVDNTIATYTSHEPIKGALEWTRELIGAGYKVVIVSNNYKKRVSAFAARFGLPYISFAIKPLPFGYVRAAKMLVPGLRHNRRPDLHRRDRRQSLRHEVRAVGAPRPRGGLDLQGAKTP